MKNNESFYGIYEDNELILRLGKSDFMNAFRKYEKYKEETGISNLFVREIEFKDFDIGEKFEVLSEKIHRHKENEKQAKRMGAKLISNPRLEQEELSWLLSFPEKEKALLSTEEKTTFDELKKLLSDLQVFLEEMQGSGRTYYSTTNIKVENLTWLVEFAQRQNNS